MDAVLITAAAKSNEPVTIAGEISRMKGTVVVTGLVGMDIPPDVWIQDPGVGGGRIIGEVCHFIDFVGFVIGSEPVAVQAMCVDTANASLVVEDNVSISISYRDGSVAQILYVAVGAAEVKRNSKANRTRALPKK